MWIHQDAKISRIFLSQDSAINYVKENNNGVYFVVAEGEVLLEDTRLMQKDAIGLENFEDIQLTAKANSHIIAIEVPMK